MLVEGGDVVLQPHDFRIVFALHLVHLDLVFLIVIKVDLFAVLEIFLHNDQPRVNFIQKFSHLIDGIVFRLDRVLHFFLLGFRLFEDFLPEFPFLQFFVLSLQAGAGVFEPVK